MCKMIKYEIWQLPVSSPYKFHHYDWIEPKNTIQIRDYVMVYSGEIPEYNNDIFDILERIFEKLNIAHPDDYHSASLSTSDVICIVNSFNGRDWWYVDGIGFKRLVRFA